MSSCTDSPRGILSNGRHHNTEPHNVKFNNVDQLIFVERLEACETESATKQVEGPKDDAKWKDEIELLKSGLVDRTGKHEHVNN
uniref:Cwf21 domain-containing protein n=1 Tax=Rhabditophanes sp. KR3021 TaxID=114890 RepID=A0AC35TK68_9BILA